MLSVLLLASWLQTDVSLIITYLTMKYSPVTGSPCFMIWVPNGYTSLRTLISRRCWNLVDQPEKRRHLEINSFLSSYSFSCWAYKTIIRAGYMELMVGFSTTASEQMYIYSRTSMARTPMARLPWLIRTRFWVPTKFFRELKKTNIQGNCLNLS